ncbi:transposase [Xanthomonas perforans]|uniref:transposase n=1 Tax=Xanthomonas perforans TaxID=442694 RepID=UPI00093862B3|nr:hypothetical protein BJD13_17960 [Xanthomonas perforans]AQS77159.1 hypothetical protein XPE_13610 [Xanthomonas perforans 91-118]TQU14622.1 hypothetical protein EIJ50_06460 [Xanthomonas perforans]
MRAACFCRPYVPLINVLIEVSRQTSPEGSTDAQEQIHLEHDRYDIEAGRQVKDVCRQLGISDATYYVWKRKLPRSADTARNGVGMGSG